MAITTAAPGDPITSALWNELAGLVNGDSDDFANPAKLTRLNSSSVYALTVGNQDTTNGLIAAFQYGPVGSATTVATITKNGIEGHFRDVGGTVFVVDSIAYTGGTVINTGVNSANAALVAANAAAVAAGGGVLLVGAGTYLLSSAFVPGDGVTLRGAGPATVFKRADGTLDELIDLSTCENVVLEDFWVDDEWIPGTGQNIADHGWMGVCIDGRGTNNTCRRITIINSNNYAFGVGGVDCTFDSCEAHITDPIDYNDYQITSPDTGHHDIGGGDGFVTSGTFISTRVRLINCKASGWRYGGMSVGGVDMEIINPHIWNTHRGLSIMTAPGVGNPGGQISIAPTSSNGSNNGDVPTRGLKIQGAVIGGVDALAGAYATGIEIGACSQYVIDNPIISDQPAWGISIALSATDGVITGGVILGSAVAGIRIDASSNITIVGTVIKSVDVAGTANDHICPTGIVTTNAVDSLTAIGVGFTDLTTANWSLGGTVTNLRRIACRYDNGGGATDAPGNVLLQPVLVGTATANGLNTLGLTIDQGAADDEGISLKSSDVAHGVTNFTGTDTYGFMRKNVAANGGLFIAGIDETQITGFQLFGVGGSESGTRATNNTAAVAIDGAVKSGSNAVALSADKNILVVRNSGTAQFFLDSDGDSHQNVGTAWTNFDGMQDVVALTTLSHALARPGNPINEEFGRFLSEESDWLERVGLVQFNRDTDGQAFVNMSRLLMLTVGAVRQVGLQVALLEDRFQALTDGTA